MTTVSGITGGLISVEDGDKKAEEFAPARKVRVELKFDYVPLDGGPTAQQVIDNTGNWASAKVDELLGRKAVDTAARDKAKAAYAAAANAAETAGKGKKDKPAKAKETPAAAASTDDEALLNDSKPAAAAAEQTELDDFLNGGEAAAEPITDAQLLAAVKSANTDATRGPKIKAIALAFCTREDKAGFTIKEIKQEHRQQFIDKLGETFPNKLKETFPT